MKKLMEENYNKCDFSLYNFADLPR